MKRFVTQSAGEEGKDKSGLKDLRFIVSTNSHFYEKTMPVLIPSLLQSGVPKEKIFVGCGESKDNAMKKREGIQYLFVKDRGFEWTGPASLLIHSLVEFHNDAHCDDYWFLLHDTCEVGKTFYSKVLNKFNKFTKENYHDYIRLSENYWSMNMGIYSAQLIKRERNFIIGMTQKNEKDTAQAHKKRVILNEDKFRNMSKAYLNKKMKDPRANIDRYETNQFRRIESYPDIDLMKYKANHMKTNIINLNQSIPDTKNIMTSSQELFDYQKQYNRMR